jgi:hypothetical protein
MASGTLGQAALAASTDTTVYTVAATPSVFNVSMVNTTALSIAVNLAIAAAATPTTAEYLEFQTVIPPNGVLERGGIVATTGKRVVAFATSAGVTVNVYGYEG